MTRRGLLLCGVISPVLYAIADAVAGLPTPWVGVKERIYWYSCQLWYTVLAAKLLREPAARETETAQSLP